MKRLLLAVNLSQLCNQVCKFAVKFTFLLYGDGGTQRFIAGVGALSLNAPFAAVIDGWNSGQSEEADVYGEQVLPELKLCGNPILVMIVHKGVKLASDGLQPSYVVGNLKEVVVIEAGVKAFVKFVISDGVKHLIVNPAAVVPVYHLTHKPEIFLHGLCLAAHFLHEVKVQHIGAVQAYSVNVKLVNPKPDDIKEIGPHIRVKEVQAGQFKVSLPGFISKGIAAGALPVEVHSLIPVLIRGIPALFLYVLKGKKLTSCVIEHTVHNNLYALLVALVHKFSERTVIAQTPVHQFIIPGIVSMAGGFKKRAYVDGVCA